MCALEYEKIHEIRSILHGSAQPEVSHPYPELEYLTAIFSQSRSQRLLLVYNIDSLSELPVLPDWQERSLEACTLADLPEQELNVYDGPVVSFTALDLIRNDILTKGPHFYPIENFFLEVGERERLLRSMHRLAGVLVDNLAKWPAQRAEQLRYRIEAKAIQLALPYMLAHWDCNQLVGVIPNKDLATFITSGDCQLVYSLPEAARLPVNGVPITKLATLGLNTQRDWVVGMDEIGLFDAGIQSTAPFFLELRHLLLLAGKEHELQGTLRSLASQCYDLRFSSSSFEKRAWMLMAEARLASIELDDLIVYSPAEDFEAFAARGEATCVYRVIYGGNQTAANSPIRSITLDTLRREGLPKGFQRFPLALIDLPTQAKSPRKNNEQYQIDGNLGEILWKIGKEQNLARSLWLAADDILNELPYPITGQPANHVDCQTLSRLLDNTLRACMIYGLSDPWRWRQGRQALFMQNVYTTLERILLQLEYCSPIPMPFYYRALRHWFGCYRASLDTLHEHILHMGRELESFKSHLEEVEQLTGIDFLGPQAEVEYRDLLPTHVHYADQALSRAVGMAEHLLQIKDLVLRHFLEAHPGITSEPKPVNQPTLNLPKTMRDIAYQADLDLLSPLFYNTVALIANIQSEWPGIVSRERDPNALLHKAGELTHRLELARTQIFALPHEIAILYSMCDRAIAFMKRTIQDIEQGAILQISLLQDQIDFDRSPDIYLEVANIGRMEASEIEINLVHSADYRLLEGYPIRTIPRLLPGTIQIIDYAIQPGRDIFEIMLQYSYTEKTSGAEANSQIVSSSLRRQREGISKLLFQPAGSVMAAFTKKTNRYQFGRPITTPAEFFGRQHELENILSLFKAGGQQNFLLHGPRRMGKTSLLYMVQVAILEPATRRLFNIPPDWDAQINRLYPVFLSLQSFERESETLRSKQFFFTLLENTASQLGISLDDRQTILNTYIEREQYIGPVHAALQGMKQMLEGRPGERIVVLLDEYDEVYQPGSTSLDINLREFVSAQRDTTWIISSTQGLFRESMSLSSPWFNVFNITRLGPLNQDSAEMLVRVPSAGERVYWRVDAVDRLLAETGNHPFFIQLFCSKVIEHLNREGINYVREDVISAVREQILSEQDMPLSQFDLTWTEVPGIGQMILLMLEEAAFRREKLLNRDDIRRKVFEHISMALGDLPKTQYMLRKPDNTVEPIEWRYMELKNGLSWLEMVASAITFHSNVRYYTFSVPLFQEWLHRRRQNENLLENALNKIRQEMKRDGIISG